MAIKITIVRHGQTPKNESSLISGMNEELTPVGVSQGKLLGKYFKKDKSITGIYTSDMIRAVQTSEAILSELGEIVRVTSTASLRERNYGEWNGKPVKDLLDKAKCLGVHPVLVTAPGGESHEEAFHRFLNFLHTLYNENSTETETRHYLLVMHAALIHGFLYKLIHSQQEEFQVRNLEKEVALRPPPNTGFTSFTMEKDNESQVHFNFESVLCTRHITEGNNNPSEGLMTC